MKIVNLLTILLAGILLCALNDVALANKTTKKVKLLHHHKHPSSTTTTHHPLPTKLHHHHHKHHRNHHKTRTSKSATPTPTPKPRHRPQSRPQPRPRNTRTTTRTTFSPPTSLSIQPIAPNNLPNNSILDTIPTTTYYGSDSTAGLITPTNEAIPNVSDPNNPTRSISDQTNQNPDSVQTKDISSVSSNGKFALAIGIAVGGVAALGLAGYAVHRRREVSRHDDNNETPPLVSTRWRHQSFLAKVESIVARLPSDSRSSRSSHKSKKSSLSGSTPTLSPAVDHTTISAASTSQAIYGGGGPEYMEEVHLR